MFRRDDNRFPWIDLFGPINKTTHHIHLASTGFGLTNLFTYFFAIFPNNVKINLTLNEFPSTGLKHRDQMFWHQ